MPDPLLFCVRKRICTLDSLEETTFAYNPTRAYRKQFHRIPLLEQALHGSPLLALLFCLLRSEFDNE